MFRLFFQPNDRSLASWLIPYTLCPQPDAPLFDVTELDAPTKDYFREQCRLLLADISLMSCPTDDSNFDVTIKPAVKAAMFGEPLPNTSIPLYVGQWVLYYNQEAHTTSMFGVILCKAWQNTTNSGVPACVLLTFEPQLDWSNRDHVFVVRRLRLVPTVKVIPFPLMERVFAADAPPAVALDETLHIPPQFTSSRVQRESMVQDFAEDARDDLR